MKQALTCCALVLLLALPASAADAPAGQYTIDPYHTSVTFRISHLGFSLFTSRFTGVHATLQFDPDKPDLANLTATIDTNSLDLGAAPPGFKEQLLGPDWLNAAKFPEITFRSTKIEMTGPTTAAVTGNLTLRGVTKPLTLDVLFNGGYAGHPMDPHARVGFSASGTLSRSDFGMTAGLPKPGTTMGVGDSVELTIEAEFTGPPLAK